MAWAVRGASGNASTVNVALVHKPNPYTLEVTVKSDVESSTANQIAFVSVTTDTGTPSLPIVAISWSAGTGSPSALAAGIHTLTCADPTCSAPAASAVFTTPASDKSNAVTSLSATYDGAKALVAYSAESVAGAHFFLADATLTAANVAEPTFNDGAASAAMFYASANTPATQFLSGLEQRGATASTAISVDALFGVPDAGSSNVNLGYGFTDSPVGSSLGTATTTAFEALRLAAAPDALTLPTNVPAVIAYRSSNAEGSVLVFQTVDGVTWTAAGTVSAHAAAAAGVGSVAGRASQGLFLFRQGTPAAGTWGDFYLETNPTSSITSLVYRQE